jgi:hypothetical protein
MKIADKCVSIIRCNSIQLENGQKKGSRKISGACRDVDISQQIYDLNISCAILYNLSA